MSASEPTEQVVAQAIGWRVRLASGLAQVEELEACQRWRGLHPSHEQAWQRLAVFDGRLGAVPPPQASQALRYRDRRTVLKGLALLLGGSAVVGSASLGMRGSPWLAGQRTAMGERRRLQLPDGGWLQMNSGSALDLAFDSQQRRINLLAGEVMIQTGKQGAERPFWVETPLGTLQALGTGFSVRLNDESALLAVEEGAVAVRPGTLLQSAAVIRAGEQVRFNRQRVFATQPLDRDALAWRDGYLVVRQWPLARLCAELGRYRNGVLRCDPAVADLLISGVFPLDEPDRALAALGRTLPVRTRYLTRWWVTLEPA
ncbi:FecR domain-containing protein [Pseudomonas putida]|uniref:FecR domain-containing protein n=1 Tax=Pseudomonas putida TaxID=303 RepID=UPI000AC1B227|nr:FecR domain-containing protein [Pseudomonas putida]